MFISFAFAHHRHRTIKTHFFLNWITKLFRLNLLFFVSLFRSSISFWFSLFSWRCLSEASWVTCSAKRCPKPCSRKCTRRWRSTAPTESARSPRLGTWPRRGSSAAVLNTTTTGAVRSHSLAVRRPSRTTNPARTIRRRRTSTSRDAWTSRPIWYGTTRHSLERPESSWPSCSYSAWSSRAHCSGWSNSAALLTSFDHNLS